MHVFARFLSWPPTVTRACLTGDLDDLWRDLLYDQYERLMTED